LRFFLKRQRISCPYVLDKASALTLKQNQRDITSGADRTNKGDVTLPWMGKSQTALRHPYGFIVLATTCLFVLISAHVGLSQGSPIKPYRLERLQPQELVRKSFTDDGTSTCAALNRFDTPCDLRKSNSGIEGLQTAVIDSLVKAGKKNPTGRYAQGIPESPYSVVRVPRGPPSGAS
jgi:hypothetical protein